MNEIESFSLRHLRNLLKELVVQSGIFPKWVSWHSNAGRYSAKINKQNPGHYDEKRLGDMEINCAESIYRHGKAL